MIRIKSALARSKAVIITVFAIACVAGATGAYVNLYSMKRSSPSHTSAVTQSSVSAPRILSDGRVGIILDKLQRNSTYPTEFRILPGVSFPSSKEGYDYVVINLTIVHIERGHMPLGSEGKFGNITFNFGNSTLVDNKGQQYVARQVVIKGVHWRYFDPHDLSKIKDPFATKDSKWFFLFEIPNDTKPAKFTFVYPFQESWEQSPIRGGNIDVELAAAPSTSTTSIYTTGTTSWGQSTLIVLSLLVVGGFTALVVLFVLNKRKKPAPAISPLPAATLTQPLTATKHCPECGLSLPLEVKHCPRCGTEQTYFGEG